MYSNCVRIGTFSRVKGTFYSTFRPVLTVKRPPSLICFSRPSCRTDLQLFHEINFRLFSSSSASSSSWHPFDRFFGGDDDAKMPPVSASNVKEVADNYIKDNNVMVFSKSYCPFCHKVKQLFQSLSVKYGVLELDQVENGQDVQNYLIDLTGQKTVPMTFVKGSLLGGCDDTMKANADGRLMALVGDRNSNEDAADGPTAIVESAIKGHKVVVFSKSFCPFCTKVKDLFDSLNIQYEVLELDQRPDGAAIQSYLIEKTGQKTVPLTFIGGQRLGGCDDTMKAHQEGRLLAMAGSDGGVDVPELENYDYDLVVIGGGSGGLAASKRAADLGARVAVLDYVCPSPPGTTWGLGGTCVNVGCIPKKLMHQSALLGQAAKDMPEFGWEYDTQSLKHNWEKMVSSIQDYIKSLNWGYRVALQDKKVKYINAYGVFIGHHRLHTTTKRGKKAEITAKHVIIATGGRPKYPDIPGAKEYAITSDDLFSLNYHPKKTLIIGASYIALECGGFLHGIGADVTVMVRSIFLRGFDQDMANRVAGFMENEGTKFVRGCVPTAIEKIEDPKEGQPGLYKVWGKQDGNEYCEEFNTILFAIGRDACTDKIGLDTVGVKTNPKNLKVIVNEKDGSNIPYVHAIGDIADGKLELTPVAIQAGRLLAERLFDNGTRLTDYVNVATTVFTPLEYGAIGYSEEDAIKFFGESNVEVFHTMFWPLEWTVAHRPDNSCYAKLVCNKAEQLRVVGFHYLGPNAGEVTQGYAVAIKMGATKAHFDDTIGIHPTTSENFTTMDVTKSSGLAVDASGC